MREHFGEGAAVWPMFNGTGANVVGAAVDAPALGRGDLRGHRAHPRRRGRRAREVRRHQAAARPDGRRQAHARADRRRGLGLGGRAPRPAARRLPHPVHRARHRCTRRTRSGRSRTTRTPTAWPLPGRRPARERGGRLGLPLRAFTTDVGVDVLVLRRHQERAARRRGRGGPERARPRAWSTCARSTCSWPRRCGSSRPSCSRCWTATCTCATRGTPTRWPGACATASSGIPTGVPGSPRRPRRTPSSPILPAGVADRLRRRFRFYDWDAATGEVRWVCSFDTTEEDVDAFVAALRECLVDSRPALPSSAQPSDRFS